MSKHHVSVTGGLLLALASVVPATEVGAAPKVGAEAKDARVEDVDGRELTIASVRGRPLVIVYEDKDSAASNAAAKDDLRELMKDAAVSRALVVAAVADVSEYASWPARGFAKDAIREASKKAGTTIWCDWSGKFRRALELDARKSNVVLVGRDGTIKWAASGPLSQKQRATLATRIRAEVGG